jgi:plasmid maintenance system antidote protein VapI
MDAGSPSGDSDPVALGRAVAAAMVGWTQKGLAEATGIPQGRISAIVNNYRGERVTLEEALRIEEAVGLPRGFILGFAGFVSARGARRGAEAAARAAKRGGPTSSAPT